MARRRDANPAPPDGRPFTKAELQRIRSLIERPGPGGHPHPASVKLEAIHRAAGRERGFMFWELGGVYGTVQEAFDEETGGPSWRNQWT